MEFNDKLRKRLEKAEEAGNKRVVAMIREALGEKPKEKEKPKPKEGG